MHFSFDNGRCGSYTEHMLRRSRHGRILHGRRPFTPRRPLHQTIRVRAGGPSLRQPAVRELLRGLLAQARKRGVQTALVTLMSNHIHWIAVPRSRAAFADATRYVFGQLARALNRLAGRSSGKVFDDRYGSTCCRSASQAHAAFGYVLRNPRRRPGRGAPDPYTAWQDDVLGADPFLRSVLGLTTEHRAALLARMAAGPVAFVPLLRRLQPCLPGLASARAWFLSAVAQGGSGPGAEPRGAAHSGRTSWGAARGTMGRVDVVTETVIGRPIEEVAAYAADPDHAPRWYENIRSVEWRTPRPLGVGSRVAFVARFLGRRLAYVYEVVALEPGARLVMRTAEGPFPMETSYTWVAEGEGATRMKLRNRGTPGGVWRLAAPLLAAAMRRANRKDLARLKRLLESGARGGAAAAGPLTSAGR